MDPIPTKPFKDVFPLIGAVLLDQINLSLTTGYVTQTFTSKTCLDTIDHSILITKTQHSITKNTKQD